MVKPLAPLIRLFFSDLLASLQDHEPGENEPWPVMIMLDEFNRLGKMPIVLDSIETLRS
jgi:type IV secretion system protein VirD4